MLVPAVLLMPLLASMLVLKLGGAKFVLVSMALSGLLGSRFATSECLSEPRAEKG